MKKILCLMALAMVAPSVASAADDGLGMRKGGYGMAGCGMGSMVFEKNSKVHQVFAATTNGTFGTQTFGISSGTSNCKGGGVAAIDREQELYVSMNYEVLSREMARGEGETLAGLSNLLGCPSNAQGTFGKMTQEQYAGVFSKTTEPSELLNSVKGAVASDAFLAPVCVN